MSKYGIVASDLDGTLLRDDMSVSEENKLAIKRLSEKGVLFVPASGRTLSEIPKELLDNENIRYIIYSNGSVLADRHTGERINMCIPDRLSKQIMSTVSGLDVYITVRQNGNSYVLSDQQTNEAREYYRVCAPHIRLMDEFAVYVEDFSSMPEILLDVESCSIFFHDDSELLEARNALSLIDGLLLAEGCPHNLEIFSSFAGKGNCLKLLADKLSIDIKETIAVGDSMNDATILNTAGLGLAMENACDELKQLADEIICNNDSHAVDYILSHYIEP